MGELQFALTFTSFHYLCRADRSIVFRRLTERGKSGQRRAPCFLTGRWAKAYSSVTENDHPELMNSNWGKGEKVR